MIEPLKDTKPTKGKEHPHIIYKRSGKKDPHGVSNCLTRGKLTKQLYSLFASKPGGQQDFVSEHESVQ